MELKFKDKTVKITCLYQWPTYQDLIVGIPYEKMNQEILAKIHKKAIPFTHVENYYLVTPKQIPINIGRKYPFGKPMRLPGTVCVMGLKYHGTSNSEVGGTSSLTLICFQNSFGPPFEHEILNEIKNIEWFSYAKDNSWEEY